MVSLSTGFQGLTASQAELVRHWYDCRNGQALPERDCLDPGAIRAHLASISMVEMEPEGQVRFRLAGSGLRKILGREMRGRLVSELDKNLSEMWSLGLSTALEHLRPVGGLIERETDAHAWLRLPLYSARAGTLVLCHDTLVSKTQMRARDVSESHRARPAGRTLAA